MSTNNFFENEKSFIKEENLSSKENLSTDEIDNTENINDEIYKIEIFHDDEKENNIVIEKTEMPSKRIYIISVLIVILIIMIIGIFLILKNNVRHTGNNDETIITQPVDYINNSNFINVDRTVKLDDETIKVTKVLVDSMATIIRFDELINIKNLEMKIIDNFKNEYGIDYDYYKQEEMINEIDNLRFEAFEETITSFILEIKNIDSNNIVEMEFTFGNEFRMPVRKNIDLTNVVIDDDKERDDMDFSIEDGIFTSSGSTIFYSIKSKIPDSSVEININPTEKMISLNLVEGAKTISTDKNNFIKQDYSTADNITYGRIDFAPIKNLNSKLRLIIDEIYTRINVNKVIEGNELLNYRDNPKYYIELNDYYVVLEGMKLYDKKFVLVAHSKNKVQDDEKEKRFKLDMDIELLAKNNQGEDIYITGEVFSKVEGTDIIFDFESEDLNYNGNIYLKINSIALKLEPISISIDLE